MICCKENTRPTNLFYFMRCATITVADWPPKFLLIWTLLRCSFTGCNLELAILSSLKLLYCTVVPTVSCSRKASTMGPVLISFQEKSFGCVTCLMLGISLPNWARECAKNLSGTWENKIFYIHLKTWAMWFSNLLSVQLPVYSGYYQL